MEGNSENSCGIDGSVRMGPAPPAIPSLSGVSNLATDTSSGMDKFGQRPRGLELRPQAGLGEQQTRSGLRGTDVAGAAAF